MKLRKMLLIIFGVVILPLLVNAETPEENAKRAKEILEKARNAMMSFKNYKTTSVKKVSEKQKRITVHYFKNNPDGTHCFRTESIVERNGKKSVSFLMINNETGMWNITKTKAIKMAYMSDMQKDIMAKVQGQGQILKGLQNGNISVKEVIFNEIPCFMITTKQSKEQLEFIFKMTKNSMPKDLLNNTKVNIEDLIPVATRQYIGKDNYFTYGTEQFNAKGKKMGNSLIYENVEINVEMQDELFNIPKDREVIIAKTLEEYTKCMTSEILEKHKNKKRSKK